MKTLVRFLALCLATNGFATDLDGRWAGVSELFTNNQMNLCDPLVIDIQHTERSLSVPDRTYLCPNAVVSSDTAIDLVIDGTILRERNGMEVGTLRTKREAVVTGPRNIGAGVAPSGVYLLEEEDNGGVLTQILLLEFFRRDGIQYTIYTSLRRLE